MHNVTRLSRVVRRAVLPCICLVTASNAVAQNASIKVGPPNGAVVVVGGGSLGPEIYNRFIDLAGGPDALIVVVPTAGGDSVYPADYRGLAAWRRAGAKSVVMLHTIHKKIADADSFVAPIKRAGGIWFDGGRQYRLVDAYGGTQSEREFMNVLARGGVVGGSSAGASILGSYMVRGAPSNNNFIISYPGYEAGFGYLRNVGIDQHVVARRRLPDLADSLMPRHPELLGISEDEGTAWVVRGDTGEIIGRNKAFVYGGKDPNDARRPFLTLRPGDRYNLATRRVIHRASEDSPLTAKFIDEVFAPVVKARRAATVLVARDGKILVNAAYGLADTNSRYMPLTTLPNFPLGAMSEIIISNAVGLPDTVKLGRRGYGTAVARRLLTPMGMHHSVISDSGAVSSNVDELYRWDQGLYLRSSGSADAVGDALVSTAAPWTSDNDHGLLRLSAYGSPEGKWHAFVRYPERRVAIIVLTSGPDVNAKAITERIAERLLFASR